MNEFSKRYEMKIEIDKTLPLVPHMSPSGSSVMWVRSILYDPSGVSNYLFSIGK